MLPPQRVHVLLHLSCEQLLSKSEGDPPALPLVFLSVGTETRRRVPESVSGLRRDRGRDCPAWVSPAALLCLFSLPPSTADRGVPDRGYMTVSPNQTLLVHQHAETHLSGTQHHPVPTAVPVTVRPPSSRVALGRQLPSLLTAALSLVSRSLSLSSIGNRLLSFLLA